HYTQNIDLRDAKTVLSNSGTAIMGSVLASGQNRAQEVIRKALDSPLLNVNKITGAKNVLLLIVSGSHEITIDEIGEINDHIQNEAGHGANIIMGVGEDEALEESIAVTIIATGFNVEQQDEITNSETRKVIHSLVDEKDLSPKDSEPVIISPVIEMEKKEPSAVRHTLDFEDIEEDVKKPVKNQEPQKQETVSNDSNLIPTTNAIRNMDVGCEEVKGHVQEEDDFIIKPVTKMTKKVDEPEDEEEQQITLTFDLPLSDTIPKKEKEQDIISHELTEDIKKMTVKDYVELITVTESNEKGDIRYTLEEDYMEVESSINKKTSKTDLGSEDDYGVIFEKKVVPPLKVEEPSEEVDPMNSPISDMLKERAQE